MFSCSHSPAGGEHDSVIGKRQRGGSSALPRALPALFLGLLAPFPAPAAGPPGPPIVNLHDAYQVHGGSMLLGGVRSLDRFGEGMAVGDITGDGVADLAVGQPAGTVTPSPVMS